MTKIYLDNDNPPHVAHCVFVFLVFTCLSVYLTAARYSVDRGFKQLLTTLNYCHSHITNNRNQHKLRVCTADLIRRPNPPVPLPPSEMLVSRVTICQPGFAELRLTFLVGHCCVQHSVRKFMFSDLKISNNIYFFKYTLFRLS